MSLWKHWTLSFASSVHTSIERLFKFDNSVSLIGFPLCPFELPTRCCRGPQGSHARPSFQQLFRLTILFTLVIDKVLVYPWPTQWSETSSLPSRAIQTLCPFKLPTWCWRAPCRLKEVGCQPYALKLNILSSVWVTNTVLACFLSAWRSEVSSFFQTLERRPNILSLLDVQENSRRSQSITRASQTLIQPNGRTMSRPLQIRVQSVVCIEDEMRSKGFSIPQPNHKFASAFLISTRLQGQPHRP